jgi:cytochrome c-type biogenesis protein CcmH
VRWLLGLVLMAFLATTPLFAVEPDEILKDRQLEERARALSSELRCLVCQNQSIDDSHAPLAKDLRVLVRQKLVSGESDDAIRSFLVERYGDFILLKPRFAADTVILWIGPFALLVLGGLVLLWKSRQSNHIKVEALDQAEHVKLAELLNAKNRSDG